MHQRLYLIVRQLLWLFLGGLFVLVSFQGASSVEASEPTKIGPVCNFTHDINAINNERSHWNGIEYGEIHVPGMAVDFGLTNAPFVVGGDGIGQQLVCGGDDSALAAIPGKVLKGTETCNGDTYDYPVLVNQELDLRIRYIHTEIDTTKINETVSAGDKIGKIAARGCAFGYDHIHMNVFDYSGNIKSYSSNYSDLENEWIFAPYSRIDINQPNLKEINLIEDNLNLSWEISYDDDYNNSDPTEYQITINGVTQQLGTSSSFIIDLTKHPVGQEISYTVSAKNKYDQDNNNIKKTLKFKRIVPKAELTNPIASEFIGDYGYDVNLNARNRDTNLHDFEYQFQVAEDSGFNSMIFDQTVNPPGVNYNLANNNGEFFARVRMKYDNGNLTGKWSDPIKFFKSRAPVEAVYFNGEIVQTKLSKNGEIQTRNSTNGKLWSQWDHNGQAHSNLELEVFNNRLHHFHVGLDGYIYQRTSTNAANFNSWNKFNYVSNVKDISSTVYNSKLYLFIVDKSNYLHIINSADGQNWNHLQKHTSIRPLVKPDVEIYNGDLYISVLDTNNQVRITKLNGETGVGNWSYLGLGKYSPRIEASQGKLFATYVKTDQRISTRILQNGSWSGDIINGGSSMSVNMADFNNNLYQILRGDNGSVYLRYFDSGNWTSWDKNGGSHSEINFFETDDKLFQQLIGSDGNLYMRATTDGIYSELDNKWHLSSGTELKYLPDSVEFNGKIIQASRDSGNKVVVRYSENGETWSPWNRSGGGEGRISLVVFNNKVYLTTRTGDGKILTKKSSDGINWGSWSVDASIRTNKKITHIVKNGKLVQAIRATDGALNTRTTTDGVTWTNFRHGGTSKAVDMEIYNGRIYQTILGNNGIVYIRKDNGYSSSLNRFTWNSWKGSGSSNKQPTLEVFNNKLYQAHRGNDGKAYTRAKDSNGSWSNWTYIGGSANSVEMLGNTEGLYQTLRGNDGAVYTRFFNKSTGSWGDGWDRNGMGKDKIDLFSYENKVYQVNLGNNNKLWMRIKNSGNDIYEKWYVGKMINSWSRALSTGETTSNAEKLNTTNITTVEFNGRLVQTARNNDGNVITRYSNDGISWSSWDINGGGSYQVDMIEFNGYLYQALRGHDNSIWMRRTTDGVNWESWKKDGYAKTDLPISHEVYDGKLYQAFRRASDKNVVIRVSTDGVNWSNAHVNGTTGSRIELESFNGSLFISIKGMNGHVYTKSFNSSNDWSGWTKSIKSLARVEMETFKNRMYMSIRGEDGAVYTRYMNNKNFWSEWYRHGGTKEPINFEAHGDTFYQAIRGNDGAIYTRSLEYPFSSNSVWGDGNWNKNGGGIREVSMISFNGTLYQITLGADGFVWMRTIS